MTSADKLTVRKPTSVLNKEIKVNPRALIGTLGKAAVNGAFLQFDDLAENGVELLDALGLEATPGEVAGLLIVRSLMQAFKDLQYENRELLEPEKKPEDLKSLYKQLEDSLESEELAIGADFFQRPAQLPIVKEAKAGFEQWLLGVVEEPRQIHARNISSRLDAYFTDALCAQWINRSQDYQVLKEQLDTPFTQANRQQQGWLRYRAWLQKKVEEPMFLESFSLQKVYVPIRAFYLKDADEEETRATPDSTEDKDRQRIVTDLQQTLEQWLAANDPNDAIRLITGGPGSGKSSFARIFAAQQAKQGDIPVLFVPLHLFRLSDDLVKAVGEFVEADGFLPENPLQRDNDDLRLLIIFDGLDELSKQGKIAEELARQFVEEVREQVRQFNQRRTRLQVIISGREVVIQAHRSKFRKPEQLLYLLPYFLSEQERKQYPFVDEAQLLAQDQRQEWWQRYGAAKGKQAYTGLPQELNTPNLVEITAQPLLNYLVALSYERDKLQFSAETNLNEIYKDLLEAVYERGYEQQRHKVTEGIEQEEFVGILEEIALACWHGDGRTTTVSEIQRHCDNSGLRDILQRLQASLQSDSRTTVTRLLTAFYFRESDDIRDSEKTFEFTHKSFGEYLTAKRIVEEVQFIHEDLEERKRNFRKGCDERGALIRWATTCGPTAMSSALFRFVCDEIRLVGEENLEQIQAWQNMLCRLIEFVLTHGMPMEGLKERPTFHEEMRQARNAEETLLATLNACARVTQEISTIAWPVPNAFGEWLSRLQGQRLTPENIIALECLSFLDLKNQALHIQDFYRANLLQATLEDAGLAFANLYEANLYGASLEGAELVWANLKRANLQEAVLRGANLTEANLEKAYLEKANLEKAYLEKANLTEANLKGANLTEANLKGTILEETAE